MKNIKYVLLHHRATLLLLKQADLVSEGFIEQMEHTLAEALKEIDEQNY